MKKQSQLQFIKNQLLENGAVSRNFCLQNFISRLGARISDLKSEGWNIKGERRKNKHGGFDYVYRLIDAPYKKVIYTVPSLGKTFTKYERK